MSHRFLRVLPVAPILATALVLAQAPAAPLKFDVASVKANVSGAPRMSTVVQPGGHFIAINAPLKVLISDAFVGPDPIPGQRVVGGPAWVESARYDIDAKASGEFQQRQPIGPPKDMVMMLRSLLEERFNLKTHHETRDMPIYELVMARPDGTLGPQMHLSANDCAAINAAGGPPQPTQPGQPPACRAMRGPARILSGGIPMERFVMMLTLALADGAGPGARDQARPVVDKTGLSGNFEFTLVWAPEQMPAGTPPPGVPPVDPNGPGLFTALQEQLGLKLQAAKAPRDVVVIDSIERPTEN